MTQNGSTTTYTYDANNRLLAETAVIPTIYTYDANRNTIGIMKGGDPAGAYAYNLFGNQVSYTPNDILYIYYTYRPDGLRHSIGDKVHIWDGANIVADIDGSNVSVYIRGINLIYANDGDKTYYHFNAHGDVVVLTNVNGNKTKSYFYSAFGVEYTPSDFDDNPFRYCGEYFDKETNTIYLRARYYDANQGRFTQEDTYWDISNMLEDYSSIIQSGNLYVYCGNNPIMFVDPMGLRFWFNNFTKNPLFDSPVNFFTTLLNYYTNRRAYNKLEYINGQAIHPQVSQCKFGLQYMSKNGCGPIAIYNAMIGCLEPQQLADIVAYCEQQGGAVLGGFLGMDSSVVAEYFKSKGFITETTTSLGAADVLLREYGHAVLHQWNDADDIFKGQHYVYIRYEDNNTITVYNEYSDTDKSKNYKSIEEYITSKNYVLIEATFIYGPKKL